MNYGKEKAKKFRYIKLCAFWCPILFHLRRFVSKKKIEFILKSFHVYNIKRIQIVLMKKQKTHSKAWKFSKDIFFFCMKYKYFYYRRIYWLYLIACFPIFILLLKKYASRHPIRYLRNSRLKCFCNRLDSCNMYVYLHRH